MWLLGHLALGYFSALFVGKFTKEKINLPLVLSISMLPDIDVFFRGIIEHRGPTHSIIVALLIFLPILLVYRRGFVYLASLASHTLIGDFFLPPEKLFWPLSNDWFGAPPSISLVNDLFETILEVTIFTMMMIMIIHARYPMWRPSITTPDRTRYRSTTDQFTQAIE